ncbi:outer membrane protein assembly factor BamC [Vogesella sp. LIG4]|uniref:outer membrane protein assembly factor BamC n=1 Tax=Vogesella sp. LIG4 TaxID=1192162 RepID=UPI00081FDFF0|nr:outer membrane protein assembly factor BamC [Vogesella sp. LIG4]SCK17391.1 Beta-barrel assembly machine subunit BamC [Vogesella sp. LIG4]
MNKTLITGLLCAGLLSACASSTPDNKYEFKSENPKAKSGLEVPPDLTQPSQQDRYPLPTSTSALAQQQAATVMAGKTAGQQMQPSNATLERAGSQRWVSVSGKSPAELWPLLKAFWQDNGFVIQSEDPEIGYMETDWAENRAKLGTSTLRNLLENIGIGSAMSTPERDRFRIRVEKTANGTDVFFTHRGMYEIYIDERKDETRWQPRPADPELEAVFLERFLVRLGIDEKVAAQSTAALATTPQVGSKAHLENGSILLDDSFDRAWRRVGLALEHNGLAITDRDRSTGVYFVTPAADDAAKANEKPGFWSSLWGSNKTSSGNNRPTLRVQLTAQGDSKVKVDLQGDGNSQLPSKDKDQLLKKMAAELN